MLHLANFFTDQLELTIVGKKRMEKYSARSRGDIM